MSMHGMTAAHDAALLNPPKRSALAHIPGEEGWPIIGRTLAILADPKGEVERMARTYGPVYRSRVLGETSVSLLGPEANELVLFDQTKLFSSTQGWEPILGRLFPRGLMLLDFDEHRLHRRALSVAFKSGPMKSYLAQLDAGIAARAQRWRQQPAEPMLFYPAMKQLTLDLAATSFLGTDIGPEVEEVTRAFVDMIAASVSPVRKPWPDDIQRERVVIEAPTTCACCGGSRLTKIGEDVTKTLEEIPRRFKLIETVREKFT